MSEIDDKDDKDEKDEKVLSEANRQRVAAIISHLKHGGGENYDNAPEHVFLKKACPAEYQNYENKDSAEILQEYQKLLNPAVNETEND
jgi:tyrosine-protein phosphatase YwqE